MTVSVAMTTFNGAEFLREQLDSIARQTRLPDELVIADDGSTDDTLAVVQRFAASAPFPIVVDAHGLRLHYNRNFFRAVAACRGEVVALCDQDDVWMPEKLQRVCRHFEDPGVTAVVHKIRVTDNQLNPDRLVTPAMRRAGRLRYDQIAPLFSPGGLQLIVRRDVVAGVLNEERPLSKWCHGEAPFDEWFFFLATLVGPVVLDRSVLGYYRRHPTATTGDPRVTNTSAFKRSLVWKTGAPQYAYLAEVANSRSEFACRSRPPGILPVLPGVVDYYRGLAGRYERRAALYSEGIGRFGRLGKLGRMVLRGDYKSVWAGGLGFRSFAKDGYTALVGRN